MINNCWVRFQLAAQRHGEICSYRLALLGVLLVGALIGTGFPVFGQSLIPNAITAKPVEAAAHRHATIITITGPIDRISWVSVRRRIAAAGKLKSSLLIFKINSWSGQLEPALKIAKLIRQSDLATVAWIDHGAVGPAAIIAAACRQVVMSRRSTWGDGEGFALTGPDADKVAADPMADVLSPALKSLQADATYHPILILAGMIDSKINIDQVHNKLTGITRYVSPEERRKLMSIETAPAGNSTVHPWVYVRRPKQSGTLLTLDAREAVRMGAAAAVVESPDDLPAMLNITGSRIPTLGLDFMERTSRFFSQFDVRFVLIVIMLVCGYLEFSHPGLLIPAMIGLIALGLFLGGPMLTGFANWWEVGIIFLGIVIIAFDFIHFGGLGLLALPGLILVITGLIATFVPTGGVSAVGTEKALQTGLGVVTLGIITAGLIIALLVRFLHITPGFRRLQLQPVAASVPASAPEGLFVGAVGRSISELRPAGQARFDNRVTSVVSRGDFIAAELPVQIVEIRENQVIVQRMSDDAEFSVDSTVNRT